MDLELLCPLSPTPVLYHTMLRFYAVLGIEPRALGVLGKHSTTEPHLQSSLLLLLFTRSQGLKTLLILLNEMVSVYLEFSCCCSKPFLPNCALHAWSVTLCIFSKEHYDS